MYGWDQAAVVNAVRATSTAPAITSTFASVTARPGPVFKCYQCSSSFKNESGLKIHIGTAHKASLPNPATAMRLYKTMYYSPKDPSPFNAPPPPNCKSCNKATSWKASRTKSNKFWLHHATCMSTAALPAQTKPAHPLAPPSQPHLFPRLTSVLTQFVCEFIILNA